MGEMTPHEDGRDSDELLAELEEEIRSWLEQEETNLLTVLNGQSVSDETTARDTIWDLVQQGGFGVTEIFAGSPALPGGADAGSDSRWSDLVATYIDSLSASLLPHTGDGGRSRWFGLDEGHAGGCG
ncbi:hypothetical protein ACF09K_24700 [Streptomyces sp. NPDC014882]|uniref:hypothetical protein n=1 Tax=Streptomyces sp. NPDC014882 TaxID=3364927 RepID=UPI0036FC8AF1